MGAAASAVREDKVKIMAIVEGVEPSFLLAVVFCAVLFFSLATAVIAVLADY